METFTGEDLVRAAKVIAKMVHAKDVDKNGVPYVAHLKAVELGVRVFIGREAYEARAAAWLHDTIEDHPDLATVQYLLNCGFPQTVVDAVVAVTKVKGETRNKYMNRIIAAGPAAMYVKLADLLHNSRQDRLALLDEETRIRLVTKYMPDKAKLMLELGIIDGHDICRCCGGI